MEPVLPTGSIVAVKPQPSYHVGDIITFYSFGRNVTHRIVEAENDSFITQGDANDGPDIEPVRRRDIAGRVIFHLPWLGYLAAAGQTPPGLLFLVIVPALYILSTESWKLYKQFKNRQDKLKQ
jgi:signal peptidase I